MIYIDFIEKIYELMLVKRCNIYANIKPKSAILRLHTVHWCYCVFNAKLSAYHQKICHLASS